MNNTSYYDLELYHHGVKGMKWGVRKFQAKEAELAKKKTAYKKAKKAYGRSFNKAYNRSITALSPFKKHRENNNKRWADTAQRARNLEKAKNEYKTAKKEFRKHTTTGQKIGIGLRRASKVIGTIGYLYAVDLTVSGGAGTKAVKAGAKYAKNKAMDKMFNTAIIDKDGKVIRRYNS